MNQIINLLSTTLITILILTSYWYIVQNKVFNDNLIVQWLPMNVNWNYVLKWYDATNIFDILEKIRYTKNDNIIYIANLNYIYENKQLKNMDLNDLNNVFNNKNTYSYVWIDWKKYHNLIKIKTNN